jgi:4-amino-4-deoxy-L-arabinose transferase-like glycosyltransferase
MPEPESSSPFVRYRVPLLITLGILLYIPYLGLRDLWYPDELDIAEVCRAMFLSGDWIAPRRMGTIWVDYPPMIYWVGTVSSHVFGTMSAFTLRLPNAITAIATVVLTCAAGSRWFSPRAGLWAGLVLLTALQFVLQAIGYRPDVLFTLFIAAGLFLYAEGVGERPRAWLRIAGFAAFGLAMLAKGPLGLLLPGLVLTLWHGSRREWRRLLELAPLSIVALAVYLPWFVACARAMGADSILYELYAQNFQRFFSGFRGHGRPITYYLTNFWGDLWPWSWLLPAAIWWIWRTPWRRDRRVQLALWWLGAFFVFLSLAVTKRQLYLLPAYPAIALLLAPWLDAVSLRPAKVGAPGAKPVHLWHVGITVTFVALGLAFIATGIGFEPIVARAHLNPQELEVARLLRAPLFGTGALLLASAAWLALAWRRRDPTTSFVRVAAVHVLLYVVLQAWVMPAFDPTKTYKPQSRWISDRIGAGTTFAMVHPRQGMGVRKRGAFGYYTGSMVELLETQDQVVEFLRHHPESLVLVHDEEAGTIFAGDEDGWRLRVIGELRTGDHVYLVVRAP